MANLHKLSATTPSVKNRDYETSSHNLNPIERWWKVMNEYARKNLYLSNAKEFRQYISYFFNVTLPDIADTHNNRMNDNIQVLKPVS
jgi:4-alpha-glucanotransferase